MNKVSESNLRKAGPPILKLGKFEIHRGGPEAQALVPARMAMTLWGRGGVGKTAFACTAPGRKLLLNVDPDGYNTVIHRQDVEVLRLEGLTTQDLLREFRQTNPFGLDSYLADNPDIETVILDSATLLYHHCLVEAVRTGIGASSGKDAFIPTMEAPGLSAYGGRNAIMLECVTPIIRLTAKHVRHLIITTHEDTPTTTPKGEVINISMMLSEKFRELTTMRLSEIWYMSYDTARDRRLIAIAPTRLRSPMKTRIFSYAKNKEFALLYDDGIPDEDQEHTLTKFFQAWLDNGKRKIPLPQL